MGLKELGTLELYCVCILTHVTVETSMTFDDNVGALYLLVFLMIHPESRI